MEKVELNKDMKLSEHFTLGELTKTSCKTKDGNIPSRVAIENLKNLCENWLEDLRYSYNTLSHNRDSPHCEMLIINSGYRSPEVNKRVGGAPTSNHLTCRALSKPSATPRSCWIFPMAPSGIMMSSLSSAIRLAAIGFTSP